jgi:hypothetical protein
MDRMRRWPARLAVAATAALLIAWFVAPVVNYRHLATACYWGDVRLIVWALGWNHQALTGRTASYWDANIFHPAQGTLAYSEHVFGIALPTLPLHLLGAGPVLVYNLAWLLSFPLLALAMYALARRGGLSAAGAAAAGVLGACSFVRIQHVGHLQLLWIFGLPLAVVCLDVWRERGQHRWLVAWALAVLTVSLASWYLAVLAVMVHAAWWPRCVWPGVRARAWRGVAAAVLAAASVAVVLAVFAWPYERVPPGPVAEMAGNSADWASYLVPAQATWSGQWLQARGSTAPRWSFGEQTLFLGWTVMLLAVHGLAVVARRLWRERRSARADLWLALGALGAIGLALSLGPGRPDGWPMPFDLVRHVPGLGLFRAPARFALVLSLVVAALAGASIDELVRRRRRLLAAGLMVLAVAELRPVAFELSKPAPEPISPLYDRLASLPPAPVISLPVARLGPFPWYDADYVMYSTRHWRLIVNGFSRAEPPGYAERMARLAAFPSDEALDVLCTDDVRYVVAHAERPFADFRPAIAAALRHPRLRVLARHGEDVLWELECERLPAGAPRDVRQVRPDPARVGADVAAPDARLRSDIDARPGLDGRDPHHDVVLEPEPERRVHRFEAAARRVDGDHLPSHRLGRRARVLEHLAGWP